VTEFLRLEKDIDQEVLLETVSNEAGSSNGDKHSDTDAERGHDEDYAAESGN
jgi:hypothetical protein